MLLDGAPDLQMIGEATNGLEAIRAVHGLHPDLLLIDIKMPMMTGLEVVQYLRNEKNSLLIVVLSNHSEPLYVEAAMRLGANGFVAKSSGLETLMAALNAVRAGGSFVDPNIGWNVTGSSSVETGRSAPN